MRISTKGRYALRFMVSLALSYEKGYVTIKSIAAEQEISEKYLEQIINILSKNGFVSGVRGPLGGYMLSMNPKDITVGMILRTVEGNFTPVFCVDDENNECERKDKCVTVEVWRRIREAVDEVVDTITLQYLAEKANALNEVVSGKCEQPGEEE